MSAVQSCNAHQIAGWIAAGYLCPCPGQLQMMGFKKAYLIPAHRLDLLRSIIEKFKR